MSHPPPLQYLAVSKKAVHHLAHRHLSSAVRAGLQGRRRYLRASMHLITALGFGFNIEHQGDHLGNGLPAASVGCRVSV
jgi:hypothetical protein